MDPFCFYLMLMIYRLGLNPNQIICWWLPLVINPLPLRKGAEKKGQIYCRYGQTPIWPKETKTMAEHLADGIQPWEMFPSKERNPPLRENAFSNTTLQYVEKHPCLGVTQDVNLRWNHHLHDLSSKATKTLILIKRNFWFCDEDTKCLLYKTLVRPKLECASMGPALWCDVNKPENIHRACSYSFM